MEIVSYPVGLLIGLLPVLVDVGDSRAPARLLLDGRQSCTVTAEAPACTVDLGPNPALHLLELVRTDLTGRVVERAARWINRPGVEAELRASGDCDEKTKSCEFLLTWAHPSKLDPTEVSVALDGVTVSRGLSRTVRVGFPSDATPQLVTANATFPDGRRATFTRMLGNAYSERSEASLEAVLITVDDSNADDGNTATSLLRAGWALRTLERGSPVITFVVTPHALDGIPDLGAAAGRDPNLFTNPLRGADEVRLVVADDKMASVDLWGAVFVRNLTRIEVGADFNSLAAAATEKEGHWIRRLIRATHGGGSAKRARTADTVAAVGYDLGGSSRRRMLVLIAGPDGEDDSAFSPTQAQAYLAAVGVPLVVWRIGAGAAKGWPAGPVLRGGKDCAAQLATLRKDIDQQRVAWIRGRGDSRDFQPTLPPGVTMAGRERSIALPAEEGQPVAGADAKVVYAVAIEPTSPQTIYAGTRTGLRISKDGGEHWGAVLTGGDPREVYAIGLTAQGTEQFIGSNGGIGRHNAGDKGWELMAALPVFAVATDPNVPSVALAATRGGVIRTTDGGRKWSFSSKGLEGTFALAIAADPQHQTFFYAATAGEGVFRSTDGGKSWRAAGLERMIVRCLAVSGKHSETVYAGTDAGVFASENSGRSWRWMSTGLQHAIVYALAVDPADPLTMFAGTAAGLFESRDQGGSWHQMAGPEAHASVSSIAIDSAAGRIFAGTLGQGVLQFSFSSNRPARETRGTDRNALPARRTS